MPMNTAWAWAVLILLSLAMVGWAVKDKRWLRVAGFSAQAVGTVMNAAAVLANGGKMPVHARWYRQDKMHCLMTDAAILPRLCDVLPFGASWGDVCLLGSAILLICSAWKNCRDAKPVEAPHA